MTSFHTHFPHVRYPIVGAPMANVSGSALAIAVSRAGGLGLIGGGYSVAKLREDVLACVEARKESPELQVGVGIITFTIKDQAEVLDLLRQVRQSDILNCFWLFGGREEEWIEPLKSEFPHLKVIVQVHTVEHAQRMVREGADVIVAQGSDAGGHGGAECSSILSLVPELVRSLPETPIWAAGGIVNGQGIHVALSLGASAAVLGTRFMLSQESLLAEAGKQLAVGVRDGGRTTIQTRVYDEMRGTTDWPMAYTGRAIRNKTIEESLEGRDEAQLKAAYSTAAGTGDFSRVVCWAGTAVGLVDEILPTHEIVKRLVTEYNEAVDRAPRAWQ